MSKRKYKLNEKVFEILTPDSMYWLGFIYADGCILERKTGQNVLSIKLSNKDHDQLVNFCKFVETDKPIEIRKTKTKYSDVVFCRTSIISDKIYNDLVSHGVTTKKSLTLNIPPHIIDSEYFNHFIRGYFDGDGSVFQSNRKNNYGKSYQYLGVTINGTQSVLNSFCKKFRWLKGSIPVYKDTRFEEDKNIYMLRLYSNIRILEFYKQVFPEGYYCLERKKMIFEDYFKSEQRYTSRHELLNS